MPETQIAENVHPTKSSGVDLNYVRNLLLEVLCLVVVGEIIAIVAGSNLSMPVTYITLAEIIALGILSLFASKYPLTVLVIALIVFVSCSAVVAFVKPSFLGGSIIIKVFILIYLARAIPEARALQRLE